MKVFLYCGYSYTLILSISIRTFKSSQKLFIQKINHNLSKYQLKHTSPNCFHLAKKVRIYYAKKIQNQKTANQLDNRAFNLQKKTPNPPSINDNQKNKAKNRHSIYVSKLQNRNLLFFLTMRVCLVSFDHA